MGTSRDMLDLLDGDAAKLAQLEDPVAGHLGFVGADVGGVIYPRSLDHDVVSALVQPAAAPSSLAMTIRLMAGHELVTEGFQPGQVGSSAMPHKMNTRSCERVNGLAGCCADTARWWPSWPVRRERGRRVLLGGAPRRAAGRVLRHRRPPWRPS